MRLSPSPKRPGFHRIVTPEETLERVRPLLRAVGVTRVSDITGLDRLGIPVWSAIVPKSRDPLSVYNGKGATHAGAKVGAMMEAIERQAGIAFDRPFHRGSYAELSAKRRVLNPELPGQIMHPAYTRDRTLLWTEGFDLFSGDEILVPADLAGFNCPYMDDSSLLAYALCSSNGLSSGNTFEEAIAQGLCEVIERDAWTLATVLGHWLPRAKFEAEQTKRGLPPPVWGNREEQPFLDDGDRFPLIDPASLTGELREVYEKYRAADLRPIMRDITSDLGIASVVVTVAEEVSVELTRVHLGLGTHLDPRIAAMRALTEAAQSRCVDIQGMREDMAEADAEVPPHLAHSKRVARINRQAWYQLETDNRRALADLPPLQTGDTLDDIQAMLARLRAGGLEQAIVVDLTNPEIGIPVARVVVPGLESWATTHGRLGWRAAKCWNAHRGAFEVS